MVHKLIKLWTALKESKLTRIRKVNFIERKNGRSRVVLGKLVTLQFEKNFPHV